MSNILPADLQEHIDELHKKGQKVVLVSGVFDLLHQEHRNFLTKAAALGDALIVAVESDVRVRQMKGEGRPVNSQVKRKADLESLEVADSVFILPEDFSKPEHHRQLIAEVRPDVFAVSSHTSFIDKKRAVVEDFGGRLIIAHQHNPEVSTTQLLARSVQK